MSRLRTVLGWTATVLLVGLILEVGWFAHVLEAPRPRLDADVLAVYGGDYQRYAAGWSLERRGHFRYLVFSDASAAFVGEMEHHFGPPQAAHIVLEPAARNTSQNARYVARILEARHGHSILVVSSWWHLPRALFLTHLALLGRGVRVRGWAVESSAPPDDRPESVCFDPRVWQEGIRFWGSLATFESDTRRVDPGLGILPY